MSTKTITPETFELGKILTSVTESLTRADVLINSKSTGPKAKKWIDDTISRRLRQIQKGVTASLGPQAIAEMESDIMSIETALQLDAFKNLFLSLSPSGRDEAEIFMEKLRESEITVEHAKPQAA